MVLGNSSGGDSDRTMKKILYLENINKCELRRWH